MTGRTRRRSDEPDGAGREPREEGERGGRARPAPAGRGRGRAERDRPRERSRDRERPRERGRERDRRGRPARAHAEGEATGDAGAASGSDSPAKGEQTRRVILLAAIDRFGQDGFRATSVAKIARDAGVGATITWAYWPNKEALFFDALDHDAAGVIEEGTACVFDATDPDEWRTELIVTLLDAVDRHPLARRVLSGLEPHVTGRVLDLPALADLRTAVADRLRVEQVAGVVRPDIDPVTVGSGVVVIVISLLTSILQFGREGVSVYGPDVISVFSAALDAAPPRRDG